MKLLDVYNYLDGLNLLEGAPKHWWPNAGKFEVVIGAVLAQNTTWHNVEKSLENLAGFLELERFLRLDEERLKECIRPSGFYNQKAPRLLALARNIKRHYATFENFQKEVSREWLLAQKGIGQESADAILCYGCFKEEMVVDAYTKRALKEFGIEFSSYMKYKTFIQTEVEQNKKLFIKEGSLNLFYARFHGMFVEYGKRRKRE